MSKLSSVKLHTNFENVLNRFNEQQTSSSHRLSFSMDIERQI